MVLYNDIIIVDNPKALFGLPVMRELVLRSCISTIQKKQEYKAPATGTFISHITLQRRKQPLLLHYYYYKTKNNIKQHN